MLNLETLSDKAAFQIGFLLYCGIDKELDRSLENNSTLILGINILEEITGWYNQNILLSGQSLSKKLELLKTRN